MAETETPAAPAVRIKEGEVIWGTGRRKSSVARVRLMLGTGRILVNRRTIEDFFPGEKECIDLLAPLKAVDGLTRYDVLASVHGEGSPANPVPSVSGSRARCARPRKT